MARQILRTTLPEKGRYRHSKKVGQCTTIMGINIQKEDRAFFNAFPLSVYNFPVIPLLAKFLSHAAKKHPIPDATTLCLTGIKCLVVCQHTFWYVYIIFTLQKYGNKLLLGGDIMSLSIKDAKILSQALKNARKERHLTQDGCAELLNISTSFFKDLERCKSTPSLGGFYNICRTLNISADKCIFSENDDKSSLAYQELLCLLLQCDEKSLSVLTATGKALIANSNSTLPSGESSKTHI